MCRYSQYNYPESNRFKKFPAQWCFRLKCFKMFPEEYQLVSKSLHYASFIYAVSLLIFFVFETFLLSSITGLVLLNKICLQFLKRILYFDLSWHIFKSHIKSCKPHVKVKLCTYECVCLSNGHVSKSHDKKVNRNPSVNDEKPL